jgi:hypothetical protein
MFFIIITVLASVDKGYNITSVVDQYPYVFGPSKSGSLFCTDPDPSINKQEK